MGGLPQVGAVDPRQVAVGEHDRGHRISPLLDARGQCFATLSQQPVAAREPGEAARDRASTERRSEAHDASMRQRMFAARRFALLLTNTI